MLAIDSMNSNISANVLRWSILSGREHHSFFSCSLSGIYTFLHAESALFHLISAYRKSGIPADDTNAICRSELNRCRFAMRKGVVKSIRAYDLHISVYNDICKYVMIYDICIQLHFLGYRCNANV